ncbi:major facilitator superfamily domain-containing protein 10, partial [Asbolus verrucosus]
MAIIADVSSMKTRGKGMAFVGMAFSLGFIVGPLIGAIFAVWAKTKVGDWFIVPALFALLLSLTDLIFFILCFKETLPEEKRAKSLKGSLNTAKSFINWKDLFQFKAVTDLKSSDLYELRKLGRVYFVYLFIYSGLEFTLTFLTHHIFNYNSMQQGWMFFSIGITMALMQGGYVRRIPPHKIKSTAIYGLWIIVPSFICVGLAQATAMVVPCIMTMASEHGKDHQKGTVMGIFRSLGALARALGPIFASIAFWSVGSKVTYLSGAFGLLWPVLTLTQKL